MNKKGDAETVLFAVFYVITVIIAFFMIFFFVDDLLEDNGPRANFIAEDSAQIINTLTMLDGDVELEYDFGKGYEYVFSIEDNKVYVGNARREYIKDESISVSEDIKGNDVNILIFRKRYDGVNIEGSYNVR